MSDATKCPRCQSPAPHLHPAVQHEGEVQPCSDPFHAATTPENTPERRARTSPKTQMDPLRAEGLASALEYALSEEGGFACPASTEERLRAALAAYRKETK